MRALKLLVIVLGVLLLLGIGALAAAMVWRVDHGRPLTSKSAPAMSAQRIVLPAGAKVIATDVDAGRLIARIELPDGGVRVLIFDLATGSEVATIDLVTQTP